MLSSGGYCRFTYIWRLGGERRAEGRGEGEGHEEAEGHGEGEAERGAKAQGEGETEGRRGQ